MNIFNIKPLTLNNNISHVGHIRNTSDDEGELSELRNTTWEDDPRELSLVKFKYPENKDKKPELGTLFWHKPKKVWFVLHTEHAEKHFNEMLNKYGPKPCSVPTNTIKRQN